MPHRRGDDRESEMSETTKHTNTPETDALAESIRYKLSFTPPESLLEMMSEHLTRMSDHAGTLERARDALLRDKAELVGCVEAFKLAFDLDGIQTNNIPAEMALGSAIEKARTLLAKHGAQK